MGDNDNELLIAEQKQLEESKLTVQARATGTDSGVLFVLAHTQGLVAPWWSKTRDRQLRQKWRECDFVAGAFYSIGAKVSGVPFHIEPRDPSVKAHWKQAETFEIALYERSDFGGGWHGCLVKFLLDLWTQDNGGFLEVLGAGQPDGPIQGPAVGVAHLDSWRSTRTGDPEFPVVYQNAEGKRFKLHHTRVVYTAQSPSPAEEMKGVGTCWLSRSLGVAQNLTDILTYNQEKLGSRPFRGIIHGTGYDTSVIAEAVQMAAEQASNAGLARFAKWPVVMDEAPDSRATLNILDLVSLPDGFDYKTSVELGMYTIAMTGGFPPRWLWPASTVGATKADAMYQHIAGATSGITQTLSMIQLALGGSPEGKLHMAGKFLPPHLKLVFDFQDDELDRMAAEIKEVRSKRHETDLADGALDVRTVREQMLADGDLTDSQFEALELASGRTQEGHEVITLIGVHPLVSDLDRDALDVEKAQTRLRELEKVMLVAPSADGKRQARIAAAAVQAAIDEATKPEPPPSPFGTGEEVETCVCPECGATGPKVRGQPCRATECPECGAMMAAQVEEEPEPEPEPRPEQEEPGEGAVKAAVHNYTTGSVTFDDLTDYVLAVAVEKRINGGDQGRD